MCMCGNAASRRSTPAAVAAAALIAAVTGFISAPAIAQGPPVKVGELNSYSRMAAFAGPYRNGMQLAQDEINAKGGLLGGRKLEIVFRDDGATPGDAVRVAEELLTRENVSFLAGTFLSNVGLAVGDFANQRKVLFLPPSRSPTPSRWHKATSTLGACVPRPSCRPRCWSMP